ncbi:MAG: acetate--CoA ligase, partial [Bacteroidota bacterium]
MPASDSLRIKSFDHYCSEYEHSIEKPEEFWAEKAKSLDWFTPFHEVLSWNFHEPQIRWFDGGSLNASYNCLDRHLAERGDQEALVWEPNDPTHSSRHYTYRELHAEVEATAALLKEMGIGKGDRVCLYMGMVPELAIGVLACTRIGAIHSVIFGGFSAQSIADRVNDAQAVAILTCDGAYRGAKSIPLKSVVDQALEQCSCVKRVLVLKHLGEECSMQADRDWDWQVELQRLKDSDRAKCPAEPMNSEDPLFILYTSGSTGKPKGVVHSTAGYLLWAQYTFTNVFQYQSPQLHFCTADIGWITGHSYIVYGPWLAGGRTLMFEGVPTWPDAGRFWDIVDKHKVDILYTAPTAIRSLMACGLEPLKSKSLASLKVLGTVGEPINAEAWHWYHEHIGHCQLPIADTWWQTETGGILISNLAGISEAVPTYATLPLPGVQPVLVDEKGQELKETESSGNLCIRFPWPGMIRSTWGDHERCRQTYFSTYPGLYFTGDGCLRNAKGQYRITGRVDDVLNVSGHRIGTAELENAINQHPGVVESAVVGFPHDIKGQGIYAFVICAENPKDEFMERQALLATVTRIIGPIAKPDKIQFVSGLPKTRSGKIMRRI